MQTGTVLHQPPSFSQLYPAAPGSTPVNDITLRYLRNTPEDAQFAANLTVEAFRGKIAHNVTESKLPIAKKILVAGHLNQYDSFYRRTLVAEYMGRSVGVCQLNFKGEKEKSSDDHICELGCWHACRFTCFAMETATEVKNRLHCYVDHIGVDSTIRGKGIGKLLLDRAEYEAKLRGCNLMFLYVTTDNRAVSLYERQGYRITDTHSCCLGCYIGPPGSVHRMEKSL